MNRARTVILLAFLCLAAAVAGAQEWRGSAALAVEVKGKPQGNVEGALVILRYQQMQPPGGPRPVLTDAAGRAVMADLAEGVWEVEVSHNDFLSFVAVVVLDDGRKPTVQASFLQASGSSLTPIRVKFMDGGGRTPSASVPLPPEAAARLAARQPPAPPQSPAPTPTDTPTAGVRRAPPPVMPEPELRPLPPAAKPTAASAPPPLAEPPPPEPAPQSPRAAAAPPPEPTVPPEPARTAPSVPEPPAPSAEPVASPATAPEPVAPPPSAPEPVASRPQAPEPITPASPSPEPIAPPAPSPEPVAPPLPSPEPIAPPSPEPVPPAPAAPEPAPSLPDPAVAVPPPEPQPSPAPAPPAAAAILPPPGPLGPTLRAYRDRTCIECRPGEWALSVETVAGPSSGPCDGALAADGAELAALLGGSIALELGEIAAPARQALGRMEPGDAAARAAELLGDASSSCRIVALVIPKAGRFRGLRIEAADASGIGDCQADRPCPVGRARWLGQPRVSREPSANVIWGLFVNEAPDRARRARLTVYFAAPNRAWDPPR